MSLQTKSMLVDLTISKWNATRHDKAVSSEVESRHGAIDAGRYNKRLIDKAHLAEIDGIASKARTYHYSRTLPWTDKGQRLLPSALFFEYKTELNKIKQEYEQAVNTFVSIYPQLVTDARIRLGTMYQASDYPPTQEIYSLFKIETEITPVPDTHDFRVDVAKDTAEELKRDLTSVIQRRQADAVKDCWTRIREVVQRISDQCNNEKGRIHDSLIENARDLAKVLSSLNITDDPSIAQVEQDINAMLVSPASLRSSPHTRKKTAAAADAILAKIKT